MENIEQLIILGNGFDLSCGLKSSYQDFFQWLENNEKSSIIHIKNENFWFLILSEAKLDDPTWFDVEGKITKIIEFLISEFSEKDYQYQLYTDSFGTKRRGLLPFIKQRAKTFIDLYANDDENYQIKMNYKTLNLIGYSNYFSEEKSRIPKSTDDIFDFLYLKLKEFENMLSFYLLEEVQNNKSYQVNSSKRIDDLSRIDVNVPITLSKIVSFNYTTPLDNQFLQISKKKIKHVHGKLTSSNIILGVDQGLLQKNIELNFSLIKFTKTYRTLQLHSSVMMSEEKPFINRDIKIVKFYGHSLGIADYSYFQSIFDALDIYNNEVYLIFYYSNYDENDRGPEQFERVYKLINDYGKTISNAEKGKNLLHKIQLENRIAINII